LGPFLSFSISFFGVAWGYHTSWELQKWFTEPLLPSATGELLENLLRMPQEVIAFSFNRSREVPLAHICSGIFRNYLFGLIALKSLEKSREVFCLIHGPESVAAQAVGLNKRGRRSKRGQQYNSQQPSGPQLCRHRRRTHLGGIAYASNGPWDAGAPAKALSEGRRQNLRGTPLVFPV